MAVRDTLPINKGDPAIKFGDTGLAVKKLQDFLQAIPSVKAAMEFQGDFGKPSSLTVSPIYGNFERDTRLYLAKWQEDNKEAIKKAGQFDDRGFQGEKGRLGFATWKVIFGAVQAQTTTAPPEPEITPPQESSPLPDPSKALSEPKATHYVKTKDSQSRLALRLDVAYVKVGKNAWEDVDKKGKLVLIMPNETPLKVIEPHLGFNCEWHQVEVLDSDSRFDEVKKLQKTTKVYCYAEFVQPLQGTKPFLPIKCVKCAQTQAKKTTLFPDWQDLDECEPFFDESTCRYYTTVTLPDTTTSVSLIESQKQKAIKIGVENLLKFYYKQNKPEDIVRYLNSFKFAEVPKEGGWSLDERPGSKLKILVSVPAKYFDAIPQRTDNLDDILTLGGSLPSGWRTVHFNSFELKPNIDTVSKLLMGYNEDIKKWDGDIPDLDLEEEVKRLSEFPSALKKLLMDNGYDLREDEEDTIEIGFEGPCFKTKYVLLNQGSVSIPMRIGIDCFLTREPVTYERTMGFVFYLEEMIRESKNKKVWSSFVQEYICPQPNITPSKEGLKKKQFDKIEKRLSDKPVKTAKEKDSEDRFIGDPDFKEFAALKRRAEDEFVGDTLLSCESIPSMIDRLSSLGDVYSEVLNKVDLAEVASLLVPDIVSKLNLKELEEVVGETILNSFNVENLNLFLDYLPDNKVSEIHRQITENYENTPVGKVESKVDKMIDVVRSVTSPEEVYTALQSFVPESVSELMDKMVPVDDPEKFVEQLSRDLPNVPTIILPDDFPTEDIMEAIGRVIGDTVNNALTEALMSIVKGAFGDICSNDDAVLRIEEDYGKENLNNMFGGPGFGRDMSSEVAKKVVEDFGIQSGVENINGFFDDLSNILKPSELCDLLDGTSSKKILRLLKGLIATKYKNLSIYFSDIGKIKDLFVYLGRFVDSKVCDRIRKQAITKTDRRCADKKKFSNISSNVRLFCSEEKREIVRKDLLEGKMDAEQLDELLEEIKKKNKEKLAQLAKIMQGDSLKGIIPPIVDNSCDKQNNGVSGIIPRDPPSVDFINDKVISVIFESVGMSFNSDMRGFLSVFLEANSSKEDKSGNNSQEDLKKSHDAVRKNSDDISGEDTEIMMKDPLAMGTNRGRLSTKIAPELMNNLGRNSNFKYKNKKIYDHRAQYVYRVSMPDALSQIKELRKTAFDGQKGKERAFQGLMKKLNEPDLNVETFIETKLGEFLDNENKAIKDGEQESKNGSQPSVCLEENYQPDELKEAFKLGSELSFPDDVLVDYSIDKFSGIKQEIKEKYSMVVFDQTKDIKQTFEHEEEVKPEIKSLLDNTMFKFTGKVSPQQEVFATLATNIWKKVLSPSEKTKIKEGTDFYSFFRDRVFHSITQQMMQAFAYQTANSPLFSGDNLSNLKLVPDSSTEGVCPPKEVEKGLFDLEKIKDFVKERYDKSVSTCQPSGANDDLEIDDTEKANLFGVVETMVRVFVIDYVLRGIFVFSEFKVQDTFGDGTIVKFYVEKIKEDLKARGNLFYDNFLKECRDLVLSRGNNLVDPFSLDFENPNAEQNNVLIDPTHPDNQSGVVALEFLIKEHLKDVSDKVEEILGTSTVDIDKKFLESWIPTYDAFEGTGNISKFLNIKRLEGNYSGGLAIERYVRVCNDSGGVVRSLNSDEVLNNFVYGLRLTYIPPLGVQEPTNVDLFSKLKFKDNSIIKNEKTFKVGDPPVLDPQSSYYGHNKDYYPFPLVSVEEETLRESRLPIDEEGGVFDSLEKKMINTDEYTLLFRYCFPLSRFLSLNAIYNIMASSVLVENLEHSFSGTKNVLAQLQGILLPSTDDVPWWQKEDPNIEGVGGNLGIRDMRMGNVTTSGTTPSLTRMALNTLPIFIKAMAEKFDPSYALIKQLHDASGGRVPLNWAGVPFVLPINIFGPFGFGPPLGPWGAIALSLFLLSGERKKIEQKKTEIELTETPDSQQDCED